LSPFLFKDVTLISAEDIIKKIDDGYEKEHKEKARSYIGASIIGNQCDAMLAFNLRGFPNTPPDPRLLRIFGLGHILEDEIVKDLKKKAQMQVWEVDGLTGNQHTYEALGGHVVCHMDGHIDIGDEELRVLEIKTMNDASFSKFKKNGVKMSHPQYYAQCQMMMGLSDIPTSFFIAVNKNNSEYHAQIIEFDEFEYAYIQERVGKVINNEAKKISKDATDWRCKGCFKRGVCWENKEVAKICKTCEHSRATSSGDWHCIRHDKLAIETCGDYSLYQPLSKEA